MLLRQPEVKDVSKVSRLVNSRLKVFHHLPTHDYALPPGGPINATMAEIIVIFPNWFRNTEFTTRFQNNGINGGIHLTILQEHRHLNFTTAFETAQARDYISDEYRKTMRKGDPKWTKAAHGVVEGWDSQVIQVNGFVPDICRAHGFVNPPSIPFKTLADGLKKLPQGSDAGDFTRALEHAMYNQCTDEDGNMVDFMFPDDLHRILDHIGRTKVTKEHTDLATVNRYTKKGRQTTQIEWKKRPRNAEDESAVNVEGPQAKPTKKAQRLQPFSPPASEHNQASGADFFFLDSGNSEAPPTETDVIHDGTGQHVSENIPQYVEEAEVDMGFYDVDTYPTFQPWRSAEQEAADNAASRLHAERTANLFALRAQPESPGFPDIPDICCLSDVEDTAAGSSGAANPFQESLERPESMDDMELSFAPGPSGEMLDLLGQLDGPAFDPSTGLGDNMCAAIDTSPVAFPQHYSLTQLLRDCIEGGDKDNNSDFARAVRWAQHPDRVADDFMVADVAFIMPMIEAEETVKPATKGAK